MPAEKLPSGWKKRLSRTYRKYYYWNIYTKESTWERPDRDAKPVSSSGPEEVRCSHILIKHRYSRRPVCCRGKTITRSFDEALELIISYRKKLVSREISFAEVAKNYSECASAKRGGELGWFGRGVMQPSFEQAAFSLRLSDLSGPVITASGIHLILRTG